MKKVALLIILGVILVAVTLFAVYKLNSRADLQNSDDVAPVIEFSRRPYVTLTPSKDGHWLYLVIDKLIIEAKTLDYDLVYQLPDGASQGTGGSIKLLDNKKIERDLLLGSESSGKYYYDSGVEKGSISLKFRDDKGKLVAKFSSEFKLLSKVNEIETPDGHLKLVINENGDNYYLVMSTVGYPGEFDKPISYGPYAILSSDGKAVSGKILKSNGILYKYSDNAYLKAENLDELLPGPFILTP